MKKILLGLSAFIMMFAASCEQQEWTPNLGSEATVSFNVATPEIAVKAYSDGTTATQLQYAVYGKDGVQLTNIGGTKEIHGNTTVELQLTTGNEYSVIFWASAEGAPYTVDFATKTMTVDYNGAKCNDEARDAFYAYREFTVTGAQTETIELKRPFAQLNIGTNDYNASENAGYVPTTSSVKVKNIYNTLNLVDGKATGEAEITFAANAIPEDETFPVSGYEYLAMNYLLVNEEKEVVDIEFTYSNVNNDAKGRTVGSVPVQRNYRTNIYGKLLTSDVDINVEIKPGYDEEDNLYVLVDSREAAQAALDMAVKGTVVVLQPNVNYGTLELRPVQGNSNTVTDCDYLVYRNEMRRNVEDLTIIGAPGATVDAIKVVSGYIENSGSTGYVVDIKNLVINSVEFTDNYVNPRHSYSAPLFFDLTYINVDGLTVKNSKLIGDNANVNFVYFYGNGKPDNSTFETAAKNIIIENNTVDGIARLCELRQTENVTIKGNTIKNTALHGMLLTVDHGQYTGNVSLTDNRADGIHNRFVRMAGAGDAVVVIKDNIITNYLGADEDFIKVTDGNNVTIENNILYPTYTVATVDELKSVLANAEDNITVKLAGVDFGGVDLYNSTNNGHRYNNANYEAKNVKIIGEDGASFSGLRLGENDYQPTMIGWTFENIKFTGNGLQISMNNENVLVKNCKFYNSELMNTGTDAYQAKNFMVQGCSFEGSRPDNRKTQMSLQNNNGVKILGCSFTNSDYSAINMTKIYGNVEIADNTINRTADRPLRFVLAANEATLKITGNTIVSNGDENGELMKVTADSGIVIAESNITLNGNTWNGKSDAEIERILDANVYIVK